MTLTKNKIGFYVLAFFSIAIGLYPTIYFFIDGNFGLLSSKTDALLSNITWNTFFYTHITLGGIALLIGWLQFNKKLRLKNLQLHRTIGKIYVTTVLISALAGFYIAYYATGGIIAKAGFITLGIIWFYTTYKGFTTIKNGDIIAHQKMMIYSYATCFAAVTLRIWLPILISVFNDFLPAYRIVAWLCWVPNIIIAHLIIKKQF